MSRLRRLQIIHFHETRLTLAVEAGAAFHPDFLLPVVADEFLVLLAVTAANASDLSAIQLP